LPRAAGAAMPSGSERADIKALSTPDQSRAASSSESSSPTPRNKINWLKSRVCTRAPRSVPTWIRLWRASRAFARRTVESASLSLAMSHALTAATKASRASLRSASAAFERSVSACISAVVTDALAVTRATNHETIPEISATTAAEPRTSPAVKGSPPTEDRKWVSDDLLRT
jgi:hypothetical protein